MHTVFIDVGAVSVAWGTRKMRSDEDDFLVIGITADGVSGKVLAAGGRKVLEF